MTHSKFIPVCVGLTALALAGAPAYALSKWERYSQNQGCVQLVKVKHPDLKGKAFGDEVKKCRANPDSYN